MIALAVTALPFLAVQVGTAASRPSLQPRVVTSFDEPSFAESLALGGDGYLYASVTTWGDESNGGQVWRISPRTGERTPFGPSLDGAFFLTGLVFDNRGRLYVGETSLDENAPSFVVRVDRRQARTALTLPPGSFPNGLAFRDGALYVSDSALGAVWRARPEPASTLSQPWFQSDLLLPGTGPEDHGIGANGIAFRNGDLYVAVADSGLVVRVPVLRNGSPGTIQPVAGPREELRSVDGIAFDLLGNLWLTTNGPGSGRLEVLTPFGGLFVLADQPSWLDYPTQPVIGTTPGTFGSVFVANGSLENGLPNVIAFGGPLRLP